MLQQHIGLVIMASIGVHIIGYVILGKYYSYLYLVMANSMLAHSSVVTGMIECTTYWSQVRQLHVSWLQCPFLTTTLPIIFNVMNGSLPCSLVLRVLFSVEMYVVLGLYFLRPHCPRGMASCIP
jgi:hypothetical protein